MTKNKSQVKRSNYLEQSSKEVAQLIKQMQERLDELEKQILDAFIRNLRASFKNGIDVGKKKAAFFRKQRPLQ